MKKTQKERDIILKQGGQVWIPKGSRNGGHYSKQEKLKAVTTHLSTGNMALTSRLCEIPLETIERWRKSDEWKELQKEVLVLRKSTESTRLKGVINDALSVVEDQLREGEYVYNAKLDRVVRVPMKARDAHRIATELMAKDELVEQRINRLENGEQEQAANALQELADMFKQYKNDKKRTIDVEIIDDKQA